MFDGADPCILVLFDSEGSLLAVPVGGLKVAGDKLCESAECVELAGPWPLNDVPEFDGQGAAVGEVTDCCEIRRHYGTIIKGRRDNSLSMNKPCLPQSFQLGLV